MAEISEALTAEEVSATYPVMKGLRPHLTGEGCEEAVRRMRGDGYRLVYAQEDGRVRAVAGFRLSESLAHGRYLYVDDLVTAGEARSRGYGKLLLDWLYGEARREGCGLLRLDSGVGRTRAHRFYFREGLGIASYHFSKTLDE